MLVEWVDSVRPVADWYHFSNAPRLEVVRCSSVGWLFDQDATTLMLMPNMADTDSGDNAQGSGFIRIPVAAVQRVVDLRAHGARR